MRASSRAAIPYFPAQVAASATNTQQDRAFAVAEGIGQKVLQDASQELRIAVDAQRRAADPKCQALFLSQRLELRAQGIEQRVKREWLPVRGDLAVLQAGNIQQIADQVLGRTQRAVQMLHQLLSLCGHAVVLMRQCG